MDGRIDGQFVIKQGGITQGIAKEFGLSSAECKQMGSVWNHVIVCRVQFFAPKRC